MNNKEFLHTMRDTFSLKKEFLYAADAIKNNHFNKNMCLKRVLGVRKTYQKASICSQKEFLQPTARVFTVHSGLSNKPMIKAPSLKRVFRVRKEGQKVSGFFEKEFFESIKATKVICLIRFLRLKRISARGKEIVKAFCSIKSCIRLNKEILYTVEISNVI